MFWKNKVIHIMKYFAITEEKYEEDRYQLTSKIF